MRIFRFISVNLLVLLFVFLFGTGASHAAFLKFDPTTATVAVGSTFSLGVVVDAVSDQITSTDMWVLYDPAFLEAQSASAGAFFPAVTSNISSGKVYIAGLVTDPGTYRTGSGTVANITFKGLKNGNVTLTYDCRTDVSNSSKVIKNAVDPTNIIVCASNGTSVVTIGTGSTNPTTGATVPTTVYQPRTSVYPTALPRSGIADTIPQLLLVGSILLVAGFAMRVLLIL